jgi:hypothetical protein
VDSDGRAVGFLADTSYDLQIDCRNQKITFVQIAEGAPFPVIVFTGESPQSVLMKLAQAVGTIVCDKSCALFYFSSLLCSLS